MNTTERIERLRQGYINNKPTVCIERARIYTESYKRTEGLPIAIRSAQAFYDFCNEFDIQIFEDELVVGTAGLFKRTALLTPEFAWTWVDKEMETFSSRPQDPYQMTKEQIEYVRKNIFPYWQGKSLEERFLMALPATTREMGVDTGIIDTDSKWRQAIGEVTPDYVDVLFPNGFGGLLKKAEAKLAALDLTVSEDIDKANFYRAEIIECQGLIRLANRYAQLAAKLAKTEKNPVRAAELEKISAICAYVPEHSPRNFHEAIQFVWFTQLGGIISENPLSLNPGRFDQYMFPYYRNDIDNGVMTKEQCEELVQALWIKYSEWVWTISSNTAGFFAGYNQFQNMTIGGRKRDGSDAVNELSYVCLEATDKVRTHQPGLSVRIAQDGSQQFLDAVTNLVSKGTGFPAIHSDQAGSQMLLQLGYDPEDARDWNNCGCVVPHFRKTGEWTSSSNVNFCAAMEFALNQGKQRLTGKTMGLVAKPVSEYGSYEEVKAAVLEQLNYLIDQSVTSLLIAQKLHKEMVPRPYLSLCVEDCLEKGVDLSAGGAHYNVGPVLTGIGLSVTANGLAVIKKLVFEDKVTTLAELDAAMNADWQGYEELKAKALAVPKYGNDDDYVDSIAREIANFYYERTRSHIDIFGSRFVSAFMGISNYIPTGRVVGATPCGRNARKPIAEGVSPFAGSDVLSPLAAMRSAAKMNHDVHSGGTLLNLRLGEDLVKTPKGKRALGDIIRAYFALGAFHVQFNTLSTDVLRKAQSNPEEYKDLLVRVAGYSTQFVNLSPEMQEAIIARTAHETMC